MKKPSSLFRRIVLIIVGTTLVSIQYSVGQNVSSGETIYRDKQVFRLKAWTTMSKMKWREVIYRFPEFQEGRITMREGFSPDRALLMNMNVYLNQIDYITDKGDTTALENSQVIKTVLIGDHLFYSQYPKLGYLQKANQTPVALGIKHSINVMMESASGERFKATDWNAATSRYDRLYIREDKYFFIDQNSKFYAATRPSILKLFPKSKKEIKKYIKTNKINFKVEADLLKVLEYCAQKK